MKKLFLALAFLFILFLAGELYLRQYWGFCDTVLMQADPRYEYIAQPDQHRFRFRRHVLYNEHSMRSKPLGENDRVRILGFGDSVINGGVQTDHQQLATTLIEDSLSSQWHETVRCLNISAGSWGPDNCFAYLQAHGAFGAKLIFLVVSSHDAYDNMGFEEIVDKHPSYPSRQYSLAWFELLDRYLIPAMKNKITGSSGQKQDPISKGHVFNPGFESFCRYAKEHHIPLLIYLHPEQSEVQAGKYNEQGQKIISFCTERQIPLVKELEEGITPEMYRDQIHPNEKGQKLMMEILIPRIEEQIGRKTFQKPGLPVENSEPA